jgi:hypothetical protein
MTVTEGTKGGGYYEEHSEYQRSVAATGATSVRPRSRCRVSARSA